uniref:F-box domain-containing protein n=1 Tax=Mycena chlorophos TaxID=658473 RepID=A0ABQ0L0K2_MYCCL|nr:predicted protein [Mycena chlorophos]
MDTGSSKMIRRVNGTPHECLQIMEILAQILAWTLEPQNNACLVAIRRTIVSLVCKTWHSCVASNPSLWSRIILSSNMSQDHVKKQFQRTKSIPKSVSVDFIASAPFHVSGARQRMANTHAIAYAAPYLRATAQTVHTLSFRAHNYVAWNEFAQLLHRVPFTALRFLSIDIPRALPHALQVSSIVGSPQTLSLAQASLHCVNASYAALVSLTLGGPSSSASDVTSSPDILHVLAQTQQLRTLRLHDSDTTVWVASTNRVQLSHLESLSIVCTRRSHRGGCGKLASYIATPSLKSLLVSSSHTLEVWVVNPEKFLRTQALTLSGMNCRSVVRHEFMALSTLSKLRLLDISGLRHARGTLEVLAQLLQKVLEIPSLESIHIPHSFTTRDAIERSMNHRLMRTAFWSAGRQTSIQIIEEHARCFVRNHQWCRQRRNHQCDDDSAPHELCCPTIYDPIPCMIYGGLKWNCADTAHATCACIWNFDGKALFREFGRSITLPEMRLPVGPDSYQCTFLLIDEALQLVG